MLAHSHSELFSEIAALFEAGGSIIFALVLVAFAIFFWVSALFKKLFFACQRSRFYEDEISRRLNAGESYASIHAWLDGKKGIVPKILNYSLGDNSGTYEEVKHSFDEARDAEINQIDKEFGVLKALIKAAPLLGLLGTVIGMVDSFSVFTLNFLNGPDLIAHGISKALITTQIGLIIALPGLFGLQYLKSLRNKLDQTIGQLDFHLKSLNIKEQISARSSINLESQA